MTIEEYKAKVDAHLEKEQSDKLEKDSING